MNSHGSLGQLNLVNGGMERPMTIDDLFGGIFRLSGQTGLHRSESESAFQDFLKKIPSTSNLAAIAAQQQTGSGEAQQGSASSAVAGPTGASCVNIATDSLLEGNKQKNMCRVPSLDFLRALVVNNQANSTGEREVGQSRLLGGAAASTLPIFNSIFPGLPGAVGLSPIAGLTHPGSLLGSSLPLPSAAATAAAARLQNSNGAASSAPASSDGAQSNDETNNKVEARRARRMLSNRESARRSRRRKQEHMNKLEAELNGMAEAKNEIDEKVVSLENRANELESDNTLLLKENERLKQQLSHLKSKITLSKTPSNDDALEPK